MAEEWEQVPRHAAQPHLVRDAGGQSSQVPGRHAGDVHTGQPEEPDNDSMGRRKFWLEYGLFIYNLYKSNCSSRIFSPALPMPDGAQVSLAGEGGGAGQLGEGRGV